MPPRKSSRVQARKAVRQKSNPAAPSHSPISVDPTAFLGLLDVAHEASLHCEASTPLPVLEDKAVSTPTLPPAPKPLITTPAAPSMILTCGDQKERNTPVMSERGKNGIQIGSKGRGRGPRERQPPSNGAHRPSEERRRELARLTQIEMDVVHDGCVEREDGLRMTYVSAFGAKEEITQYESHAIPLFSAEKVSQCTFTVTTNTDLHTMEVPVPTGVHRRITGIMALDQNGCRPNHVRMMPMEWVQVRISTIFDRGQPIPPVTVASTPPPALSTLSIFPALPTLPEISLPFSTPPPAPTTPPCTTAPQTLPYLPDRTRLSGLRHQLQRPSPNDTPPLEPTPSARRALSTALSLDVILPGPVRMLTYHDLEASMAERKKEQAEREAWAAIQVELEVSQTLPLTGHFFSSSSLPTPHILPAATIPDSLCFFLAGRACRAGVHLGHSI